MNVKQSDISFCLISFHLTTSQIYSLVPNPPLFCASEISDLTLSYFRLHRITKPVVVTELVVTTSEAWVCGYCSGWLRQDQKVKKRPLALCSVGPEAGTMTLGVFSDILKQFQQSLKCLKHSVCPTYRLWAGIQPSHAYTLCTLLHYHPHTCTFIYVPGQLCPWLQPHPRNNFTCGNERWVPSLHRGLDYHSPKHRKLDQRQMTEM